MCATSNYTEKITVVRHLIAKNISKAIAVIISYYDRWNIPALYGKFNNFSCALMV